MLDEILKSALSIFMIMGPFASIPVFFSLTKDMDAKQRASAATRAIVTAAFVLYLFLFFGKVILDAFTIDLASLRIAGGIVLTILGIELMLGISVTGRDKYSPAITLLATPLLTGPGVIITTMIFVQEYGYLVTTISSAIALFGSWLVLWFSWRISRAIRSYWIDTISRVTGLLLAALAVQFIISGIEAAFFP
jgi:multiple antibiotic resistance protein